jgi:2-dehydro-3-deoxyphosphooctonate aldolase (KDO 8-P synthase)
MRSFPIMRAYGAPVVYDITHSMQRPGGRRNVHRRDAPVRAPLARAAAATGVDGFFMEVHDNPDAPMSDRTTQLDVATARQTIREILAIRSALAEME